MIEPLSASQALALFDYCPIPVLIRDHNGRVTAYNAALEQLLGVPLSQELGQLDPTSPSGNPAQALLDSAPLITWTDSGGQQHYFKTHDMGLPGSDQLQARFLVDVSETVLLEQSNIRLAEELKQHILTDPVTGLLNRRGIMLALEPQVARSRRYTSPISVVALRFGSGETREDLAIDVARLLKDQLRWADLVGYTENREFIIVLPETTAEAASKLIAKLQERLQQLMGTIAKGRQISASYGIADWRKNDNASTLLKRAEKALQEASLDPAASSIAL